MNGLLQAPSWRKTIFVAAVTCSLMNAAGMLLLLIDYRIEVVGASTSTEAPAFEVVGWSALGLLLLVTPLLIHKSRLAVLATAQVILTLLIAAIPRFHH